MFLGCLIDSASIEYSLSDDLMIWYDSVRAQQLPDQIKTCVMLKIYRPEPPYEPNMPFFSSSCVFEPREAIVWQLIPRLLH